MHHIERCRSPRSRPPHSLLAFALLAAGCAQPAAAPVTPPARPKAAPAQAPRAEVSRSEGPRSDAFPGAEAAQIRAQRAWCEYLDALYKRATNDSKSWPRRAECLAHTSNAAPAMLEHTASCSMRALDAFVGDPLTPEYAAHVRRCGVEALDALAMKPVDLEPFLEVICRRAETCDSTPYVECRAALAPHIAARLGRAIGAINEPSRARLRVCLRSVGCEVPIGDRLSGCIEPIMEKLLWLPPGHDE